MRAVTYLGACALVAIAAPASAAFSFDFSNVAVLGVTETTLIQSGCGVSAICSITTSPYSSTLSGFLIGSVQILDGTFTLSGNVPTQSYDVTLSFVGGVLQSTSLSGNRFILNGSCPLNCVTSNTTFGATSFPIAVTNTTTGVRSILAPVPEPATWAMMLVGFGAMGVSLRRRRRIDNLRTT